MQLNAPLFVSADSCPFVIFLKHTIFDIGFYVDFFTVLDSSFNKDAVQWSVLNCFSVCITDFYGRNKKKYAIKILHYPKTPLGDDSMKRH